MSPPLEFFLLLSRTFTAGAAREKVEFFFDMFDFRGRQEASYDEVAIFISTIVGALSKARR